MGTDQLADCISALVSTIRFSRPIYAWPREKGRQVIEPCVGLVVVIFEVNPLDFFF